MPSRARRPLRGDNIFLACGFNQKTVAASRPQGSISQNEIDGRKSAPGSHFGINFLTEHGEIYIVAKMTEPLKSCAMSPKGEERIQIVGEF